MLRHEHLVNGQTLSGLPRLDTVVWSLVNCRTSAYGHTFRSVNALSLCAGHASAHLQPRSSASSGKAASNSFSPILRAP